jgi:hypothetical protein
MTLSVGHRPRDPDILVMEAWGQGFLVGSLVVMIAITAANMKKGVLLHKLIVAEVGCAVSLGRKGRYPLLMRTLSLPWPSGTERSSFSMRLPRAGIFRPRPSVS